MVERGSSLKDYYAAEPLHYDCVVCHARSMEPGKNDAEDATVVILSVLLDPDPESFDLDDMYRHLCFQHRRAVDDVCRGVANANKPKDAG